MIDRLARFLDDRMRAGQFARTGMRKVFPEHWSFLLGEIALYSFVVLLVTGIFLAFFFDASFREVVYSGAYTPMHGREVSAAYASVLGIVFEVPGGLLIRQIHHWAALVFVGSIVVHLMRIFFTGAFRRPRELNWVIGVDAAGARHRRGLRRLQPARRPALRRRAAHRVQHHPVDPRGRDLAGLPGLGRRVPQPATSSRACSSATCSSCRSSSSASSASTCSSSSGRSTPSSPGPGAPTTTSSANGCGRPTPPSRSACCSSWLRSWRCSAAWCRSTRSGCTGPSTRRPSPPSRSPTGTWAGSRARCG